MWLCFCFTLPQTRTRHAANQGYCFHESSSVKPKSSFNCHSSVSEARKKARNSVYCIRVFNEEVHKPSCEASDARQNGPTCSEISFKFYKGSFLSWITIPQWLHGLNVADFMLVLDSNVFCWSSVSAYETGDCVVCMQPYYSKCVFVPD